MKRRSLSLRNNIYVNRRVLKDDSHNFGVLVRASSVQRREAFILSALGVVDLKRIIFLSEKAGVMHLSVLM